MTHVLTAALARQIGVTAVSLLCVIFLTSQAKAAEIDAASQGIVEAGAPPYELLTIEALGLDVAPTDVREMPDGRILLVAGTQLALGDGARWRIYNQAASDSRISVRSAGVDRDGAIYVPTSEGVARVVFSEDGHWRPQHVAAWSAAQDSQLLLPEAKMETVGDQWLWYSLTGAVLSWRPGQQMKLLGFSNTIETVFKFENDLYVSEGAGGSLRRLESGAGEVVRSEGTLSAITATQALSPGQLLVGTQGRGLQIYDGTTTRTFSSDEVFTGEQRINALCRTEGGFLAAAVEGSGLVFFRENGRVVQVLDRVSDSRFTRIKHLINTAGGVVWGLLDAGVLRVQFPSKVGNFEAQFTNGMTTAHPYRFDGKLWLLADGRLYRGVYNSSGRMISLELDSPRGIFVNAFSGALGVAVAGTEQGAFVRDSGGWRLFAPDAQSLRIIEGQSSQQGWFYMARNEVGWIRREGDRLVRSGRQTVKDLTTTFNKPVIDGSGRIWLELGSGRIARVELRSGIPNVQFFSEHQGVPASWPQLFVDEGDITANMGERFWRFDETAQRFVHDDRFLTKVPGVKKVFGRPGVDARGRLWIVGDGELQIRAQRAGRWSDLISTVPLNFAPYFPTFERDGVTWLHAQSYLARFDPRMPTPAPARLSALVTEVSVAQDRRHFFAVDNPLPRLPYEENTLVIRYSAIGKTFASPLTFETRLEGDANPGWASVGSAGSTVLDELDEGDYVLRVRPRQGGVIGDEDSIAFSIAAPWYRTPLAYFSSVATVVSLILVTVWLLTLFERRKRNQLEQLVAARTGELQETNVQLAHQMDEIRVLTQAIEQSPVALFITSPEGIIEYTNPRTSLLTGRTADELLGFNLNALRPSIIASSKRKEIDATLACGESWSGELALEHSSGRIIPVRSTLSPITGQDKRIHHLVIEDDITEWVEAQERRRRLESQLAHAQKMESIGTLAGGIAHDFNNLLTGILGYSELAWMNAEEKTDNTAEIDQIRKAALRAKDLVNQILTFSRKNEGTRIPLDLRRPVEEALRLLHSSVPPSIEFVRQLESGTVQADASQIHQIVINLCTNALHAMCEGRGTLTVYLKSVRVDEKLADEIPHLHPGMWMCLSVTDTGYGIDAAILERIFDPFFTTKSQGKGTGLGLAIVQGAVMNHGGAMRVRSRPGDGTTFELYFPLIDQPVEEPAAVAAHALIKGNGEEVLIVDDEPLVAEYAHTLLDRYGYRCTYCTDPRDALAAFKAAPSRFSILITDLTMPHLTGVDLIERIRAINENLPVIILTGYGDKARREQIAEYSRCELLQKPVSGEELLRRMAELIRRPVPSLESDSLPAE
ncbi:MAG: ATP-binding protein [Povalibacter sp.]